MPFNYNDINYSWTIQKIANEVIMGYHSGKDAMELFIKAAETHQLTPDLIDSTVHHINNEIYLDRLNKKAEGKFTPIHTSDVLKALGKLTATGKTASEKIEIMDYWNINEEIPVVKVAHDIEKTEDLVNREKTYDVIKTREKKASDQYSKRNMEAEIMKMASNLKKQKEAMYNETLLSLNRENTTPEEVYFLSKISSDMDLKEIYLKSLEDYLNPKYGRPNSIDENKVAAIANEVMENEINEDFILLARMKEFQHNKQILDNKIQEYDNSFKE